MSVSSEVPPQLASGSRQFLRASQTAAEQSVYGRDFWCAYVANTAMMVAVSLLYRYADFVTFLGGDEWNVGLVVGTGMVGSLFMRSFQGFGIDHFGARRIWLWSMVLFSASLAGHLAVQNVNGPVLFVLRICYTISLAGAFGASITSVSRSLPLPRMAEVVGSLGTSGFIAMALGPQLGDFLCGHENITRSDLDTMFLVAAGLGIVSLLCAELATRSESKPKRRRKPPVVWLLRRYHPGGVLVLAVVMGIGFVIPTTFLPTFTKELNIEHTGTFFLVYAATAFLARVSTRRFPQLVGVRPMILIGLAALVLSLVTYMGVSSEWELAFPGVFAGIAHALLFPAVTAQGSTSFPSRYRGLGTTLMLSMLDIGTLTGAPLVGRMVEASKSFGLPPYKVTFSVLAAGVTLVGIVYGISTRRSSK
ncbi:MAG TPA: MFS transporter [Pirellulales bacterium]|jgi:MFS family permease|nr:MFS transporter [Pirellulales bacterium]